MIGIFYNINGGAVKKEPLKLHGNFFRAVAEAQAHCKGRQITVNSMSKWALVGNDNKKPVRIFITEE